MTIQQINNAKTVLDAYDKALEKIESVVNFYDNVVASPKDADQLSEEEYRSWIIKGRKAKKMLTRLRKDSRNFLNTQLWDKGVFI